MEALYVARNVSSLWKLRMDPSQLPARKWEHQSYSEKELNSAHNLNKFGTNCSFPQSLHTKIQPGQIPCDTLSTEPTPIISGCLTYKTVISYYVIWSLQVCGNLLAAREIIAVMKCNTLCHFKALALYETKCSVHTERRQHFGTCLSRSASSEKNNVLVNFKY